MDVVQHDHDRCADRRDRRTEPRDGGRPQCGSSPRHPTEHAPVDGLDRVQRRRDVAQEHNGVVVRIVERDPGERPCVLGRPLGEQRGLAVPGGRRDADVARRVAPAESRDERRPAQRAPPLRRNCEFRREQVEGGRAARLLGGTPGPRGSVRRRSLAIDALYQCEASLTPATILTPVRVVARRRAQQARVARSPGSGYRDGRARQAPGQRD